MRCRRLRARRRYRDPMFGDERSASRDAGARSIDRANVSRGLEMAKCTWRTRCPCTGHPDPLRPDSCAGEVGPSWIRTPNHRHIMSSTNHLALFSPQIIIKHSPSRIAWVQRPCPRALTPNFRTTLFLARARIFRILLRLLLRRLRLTKRSWFNRRRHMTGPR